MSHANGRGKTEKGQLGPFRASQAKQFKATQGQWPERSVKPILDLLKNAESNADAKNLESNELIIKSIIVNQAPVRTLFCC